MSARKTPGNSRTKDQATTKASKQQGIPRHSSSHSSRPASSITSSASSNSSQTGSKRSHRSSQSSDGSAPAPPTKRRRGESAGKRTQKISRIIFDSSEGDDPTQQDDEDILSSSDQEDKEEDVLTGDGSQGAANDQGKSQLKYIAQQDKAAFIDLGRAVQRSIVAWTPLHTIFYEGLIRVSTHIAQNTISDVNPLNPEAIGIPEASDLEFEDVHATISDAERDELYTLFCKIYRMSPKLCMKIVEAESRFNKFVGYVSSGAGAARATDLRAVRVLVTEWGNLKKVAKAGRGFHHPFTAALLMPCDQSPADQEFLDALKQDERLAFPQSAEPPRFLYGGDLRRPVNLDAANSIILRNPYLLAAWLRVYQSDDSAIDLFTEGGKGDLSTLGPTADPELLQRRISSSSRSVGHTNGVKSTTPHTVGYVSCLLRAALSSDEKLTGEVDDPEIVYNYSALYAEVVQTMKMTGDPATDSVVKSIVEWWDRHAFPRNKLRQPVSLSRLTMRERMAIEAQAATPVSTAPSAVNIPLGGDPARLGAANPDVQARPDIAAEDAESLDDDKMDGDTPAPNGPLRAGSVDVPPI
ncbi:hypothetical protein M407DRAFT_22355 [Tulasnella calospora MUT 4182]|uniref:Uncharacterized protein n=1 Tax=Tulasnella calospora MUT 4182 TaxID=1051891 RepID=A0A0C3QCK1_9AGAM|nr:hypothetical protein M407DRAFT_22355 [Tulasnella calospora MUT 4182]